jgi:hypothetical protein
MNKKQKGTQVKTVQEGKVIKYWSLGDNDVVEKIRPCDEISETPTDKIVKPISKGFIEYMVDNEEKLRAAN